jgi:hypothetical protein
MRRGVPYRSSVHPHSTRASTNRQDCRPFPGSRICWDGTKMLLHRDEQMVAWPLVAFCPSLEVNQTARKSQRSVRVGQESRRTPDRLDRPARNAKYPRGVLHKKPHNGVRIDCRVGLRYGFTPARPAWPGKSAHAAQVARKDRRPRTLPVSSGNDSLHGQTLSMAARTVPIASGRVSRALVSSGLWGLVQRASDEFGVSGWRRSYRQSAGRRGWAARRSVSTSGYMKKQL